MSNQKSMLSTVRGYNIRTRLLIALLLIAVSVGLCFALLPKTTKYILASKNVFAEPSTRLGEEKFYCGETQYMYVWFADNNKGRFYLAPMEDANGNASYMVVYVPNKYIDKADELVEQTREYERTGDPGVATETLSCRGYTTKPSSQIRQFLDQYFSAISATNDIRESVCDYMFVMVPATEVFFGNGSTIFYLFLFAACMVAGIFMAITAFSGGYLRKFKKSLANKNITLDELNADMEGAMKISRLFIGNKYVVEASLTPSVRNMHDFVWVYPQKTNTSGSAVVYSVLCYTRYHECVRYQVHSMDEAEQLCRKILAAQPRALYGYVIENSTMYYSHFNELVNHVYNPAPEQQQEQPQVQEQAQQPTAVSGSAFVPTSLDNPGYSAPAAPEAPQAPAQPEDHNNDILRPGI